MAVNNVIYIYTYGLAVAAWMDFRRAGWPTSVPSAGFWPGAQGRRHHDGGDARFASYLAGSGIGWSEDIHDLMGELRACRRDQAGTLLKTRQSTERIAFLVYDRTSGLFYGK